MNTTTRNTIKRTAAAALASGITVTTFGVLAAPAEAKDGDVLRRGSCSGATSVKLKLSREDGRIESEGEVDSNRNGQTWRWRLSHDGSLAASGTSRTHAPSGSFEVRRLVANHQGRDRITFRARNVRSGEVCRVSVSF